MCMYLHVPYFGLPISANFMNSSTKYCIVLSINNVHYMYHSFKIHVAFDT